MAIDRMTIEEARNLLRNSKPKGNNAHSLMLNEALEMAITALDLVEYIEQRYEEECNERREHYADGRYHGLSMSDGASYVLGQVLDKWKESVGDEQKARNDTTREKTCKNCINAKECVMYEPNMKRCKAYKEDSKEIYNKGFADGQKAFAEHLKLCKKELLDKIRAEIEQGCCEVNCEVNNDFDCGRNYGLYMATQVIDKYKTESEDKHG